MFEQDRRAFGRTTAHRVNVLIDQIGIVIAPVASRTFGSLNNRHASRPCTPIAACNRARRSARSSSIAGRSDPQGTQPDSNQMLEVGQQDRLLMAGPARSARDASSSIRGSITTRRY